MVDRIVERDEKGRIKSSFLSSEAARDMITARWEKEDKAGEGAAAILSELGFTEDNPAPALIGNLAEIAVSQKTGAVSAIGTLLKLAHGDGNTVNICVREGEFCPTCGMFYPGLGADLAAEVVKAVMKGRAGSDIEIPERSRKNRVIHG